MHQTACYFPVVPNRQGEITAVSFLSPRCRARARIVFEIDRPREADASELEEHVAGATRQIGRAWGTRHPLLVDLPAYGLEHRVTNGSLAIEQAFTCLRQLGVTAVPVAGPISARGAEVLEIMRDISVRNRSGAALRFPFYELSHTDVFQRELRAAMQTFALDAGEIDLLLDLEAVLDIPVLQRSVAHLTAVIHEALAVVRSFGNFRNIVLCGSSVPQSVGKEYDNAPYRGRRIELDIWRTALRDAAVTLSFSDNGITASRGEDPRGFGPAPARIRLSTPNEHVFYRAKSKEYIDLCQRVVSGNDFDGKISAWGAAKLRECANEHVQASSPTIWVARDTNLHNIETTLSEIERCLSAAGRITNYKFPAVEVFAWLQQTILEDEISQSKL